MMLRLSLVLALFAGGCATTESNTELPLTHPANPAAASAPLPRGSTTLDVAMADPVLPARESAPAGADVGGTDHAAMGHGAHGAGHAAAPAAQASGQTLYVCPMHPEVTATNPNDRCPTCNMKINEPAKGKAQAAAPKNAAHDGHGGHEGHGANHQATHGETHDATHDAKHHGSHDAAHDATHGAAPSSPVSTQASGQTLYMCPMHPEVTSKNPSDRCPKCNMKINKPVKEKAPKPATSAGHEGHGGQHQ